MSKKEISRNPSFTPSPKLRAYLNESEFGVTAALNDLYDRYTAMLDEDAIRLTPDAQFALQEFLMGVFIDRVTIQALSQDIPETGNEELIATLGDATYSQTLATLIRYGLMK